MARIAGFVVFCLAAVGAAWFYVSSRTATTPGEPIASTASPERIRAAPHVYFSSMRTSEFGHVVIASLDAPNDQRFVTDLECQRIDFAVERGFCLVDNRANVLPPAIARIVDRDFKPIFSFDLPGFPSRTRISADERYGATTVFVTGESYTGDFATRTYIVNLQTGELIGDLERFTTWRDGGKFSAVDFNFWGVTFTKDSNRFYATLATGGAIYLVDGNVSERSMRVLRQDVECPSLSPDETHIAFKLRQPSKTEWRLHVLDLATMKDWPIPAEDLARLQYRRTRPALQTCSATTDSARGTMAPPGRRAARH